MTSPIILAVDTRDLDTAKRWIDATRESVSVYKLGLEFFLTFGAVGVREIANEFGVEIFLDLKKIVLHWMNDIFILFIKSYIDYNKIKFTSFY